MQQLSQPTSQPISSTTSSSINTVGRSHQITLTSATPSSAVGMKRTNAVAELGVIDSQPAKRLTRSSVTPQDVLHGELPPPTHTKLSPDRRAQAAMKAKATRQKKLELKAKLKLERSQRAAKLIQEAQAAKMAQQAAEQAAKLAAIKAAADLAQAQKARADALLAIPLPSHWEADPTNTMLIELDPNNPNHTKEYNDIVKYWDKTQFDSNHRGRNGWNYKKSSVSSIQRIQNSTVYRAYEQKKAEMLKVCPGKVVDVHVYHGSSGNKPDLIVKGGFDISRGSSKANHLWFASDSGYSSNGYSHHLNDRDNEGGSQIFLCRIIPVHSMGEKQDQVGTSVYTIGANDRILPTHLITYKLVSPPPTSSSPRPTPSSWFFNSPCQPRPQSSTVQTSTNTI